MTNWFAIYDLGTYNHYQVYEDVILCDAEYTRRNIRLREKLSIPREKFFDIKENDSVIYYAMGAGVVVGIFKVLSNKTFFIKNLDQEKYLFAKKIRKIRGLKNEYLNFKKLSENSSFKALDIHKMLEKKETWRILEDDDYNKIEQAYDSRSLLIKIKNKPNEFGPNGWIMDPEVSNGILSYYNGRATSFSSLFLASIFGLLTLAAILQLIFNQIDLSLMKNWSVFLLSSFLYLFFIIVGYYTLSTYFHYTGLADSIKNFALDIPYKKELEKVWAIGGKDKIYYETNLSQIIVDKERKYSNSLLKKYVLRHKKLFIGGYILALSALTLIIYWNLFLKIWSIV